MKRITFNFAVLIILALPAFRVSAQPNQVVRVAPGFATVIVCPVQPELVTVGNMDAFSIESAGNYILIKPLVSKGTTNMFIKAGAESFNLLIQVSDTPDLEVRLTSNQNPLQEFFPEDQAGDVKSVGDDSDLVKKRKALSRRKSLSSLSPKALALIANLFKSDNRYTYSVNNSKVIFAVDHMKQIKDKLFLICTIINNSNIPYDVGFVRFKMIDYASNFIFWKKKLKETDLEPVNEYYNSTVKPHTFGRLLFIFDKQGYSDQSTLNIKCNEESGRRDLVLEIPGSFIE